MLLTVKRWLGRLAVVRGCHCLPWSRLVASLQRVAASAALAAAPAAEEHNGVLAAFELVLEARKSHLEGEN